MKVIVDVEKYPITLIGASHDGSLVYGRNNCRQSHCGNNAMNASPVGDSNGMIGDRLTVRIERFSTATLELPSARRSPRFERLVRFGNDLCFGVGVRNVSILELSFTGLRMVLPASAAHCLMMWSGVIRMQGR